MDIVTLALAKNGAKTYTDNKFESISGGFDYKGNVATVSDLPTTGNIQGDEYTVTNVGTFVWDGSAWQTAGVKGNKGDKGDTGESGKTKDVQLNGTSIVNSGTGIANIVSSPYSTTVPTEANTSGIKIVVLDEEPETKYDGYLYLIKE